MKIKIFSSTQKEIVFLVMLSTFFGHLKSQPISSIYLKDKSNNYERLDSNIFLNKRENYDDSNKIINSLNEELLSLKRKMKFVYEKDKHYGHGTFYTGEKIERPPPLSNDDKYM